MSIEKARAYYTNKSGQVKLNCGQAVLAAFKDKFSISDDTIDAFGSYGSGKAPGGECGAYHAVKNILGTGSADKVKECEAFFFRKAGSTKCKEIRQLRRLPCLGCVEAAAGFLDKVERKEEGVKLMQPNGAGITRVQPEELVRLIAGDPSVKILDVRSAVEFNSVYIKDSINIPLETLGSKAIELARSGNSYVVLCRMGNRAISAADILRKSGISRVMIMDGGITKWQKNKLPVVRGNGGISLERQTRMIAGSMVVFGVAMGLLAHWAFSLVALFAGCGLVFAGVTDNCLMGILLMKLPYNKKLYGVPSACGSSCSASCG